MCSHKRTCKFVCPSFSSKQFGVVSKSLFRPEAAGPRTAKKKKVWESPKTVPPEPGSEPQHSPKTVPEMAWESPRQPKNSPRNVLGELRNQPRNSLGKQSQTWSARAQKTAQTRFGRDPPRHSPISGLGEPQNQRRNGLETEGTKLALGKLKPRMFCQNSGQNFRSKLAGQLRNGLGELQHQPPNRARAPGNGLKKFRNQPRNGLESQGTKLAVDKLKQNFRSKLQSQRLSVNSQVKAQVKTRVKAQVKTQGPKPYTISINPKQTLHPKP